MTYASSFLIGLAFGGGYALLGVRSPAPPIAALIGLLGMVLGERGWPWLTRQVAHWAQR